MVVQLLVLLQLLQLLKLVELLVLLLLQLVGILLLQLLLLLKLPLRLLCSSCCRSCCSVPVERSSPALLSSAGSFRGEFAHVAGEEAAGELAPVAGEPACCCPCVFVACKFVGPCLLVEAENPKSVRKGLPLQAPLHPTRPILHPA